MKNPTIATLLNIIPGLAYLYLKSRRIFGVALLASLVIATVSSVFNPALASYYAADYNVWDYVGLISIPPFIGAFMYDAYRETLRINTLRKSSDA